MMRLRGEAGLTLPELMITMAILGIIIAAISGALITGLKNDQETIQRFAESHDAQLASIYLQPDVQSATTVVLSGSNTGGCSGGSEVVALRWQERLSSFAPITQYVAAYRVVSSGGEWQFTRFFCVGSGAAAEQIVARSLQASCPAVSCFATETGRKVSVTLTEASGFAYTISGTRRSA